MSTAKKSINCRCPQRGDAEAIRPSPPSYSFSLSCSWWASLHGEPSGARRMTIHSKPSRSNRKQTTRPASKRTMSPLLLHLVRLPQPQAQTPDEKLSTTPQTMKQHSERLQPLRTRSKARRRARRRSEEHTSEL